ncbi:MAG: PAS domain-containing protein [Deltaproteobacteria bacterium]|nr:PAS domain-containing protein [Deltaproteobacteria bacterium]
MKDAPPHGDASADASTVPAPINSGEDFSPEFVVKIDAEGQVVDANPSYCSLVGARHEEIIDRPFTPKIHEEDRERTRLAIAALHHPPHASNLEQRSWTPEGWRWIAWSNVALMDDTGHVTAIVCVGRDVTARRDAAHALKESELRLRTLIDAMPDIVCFKDGEGRWLEANRFDLKLFGLTSVDYRGKTDAELAVATPFYREAFRTCQETDEHAWQKKTPTRCDEVIVRPDGEEKTFDVIKLPFFNEDGSRRGLLVLGRDITERIELENRLLHAAKMEAVGQLAGGVAHDFNNLLTVILDQAEALESDFPPYSPAHDVALTIAEAGRRAIDLTTRLLGFSRRGKGRSDLVDIERTIIEVGELVKRTFSAEVRVSFELEADRAMVLGDPVQLHQVLLNLALNAQDAMPEGGNLVFRIEERSLTEAGAAVLPGLVAGPHLAISLRDTGIGIAPDLHDYIFEPFFTTKHRGKGSGLGLAVAYQIIEHHHGHIRVVDAGQECGTTFEVLLPLADAQPSAPARHRRSDATSSLRVLVVEDELFVRRAASAMLRHLGHHAIEAEDGESAIEVFEAEHETIDLVLLDLVMPRMNGVNCFFELKRIDPTVRAVLCSGYGKDDRVQAGLTAGVLGFLEKPYTKKTLNVVLQEILGPPEDETPR